MIRSIKLRDWKSFQDAQLYIDPMTFVIGTNASGKSNVLEALIFVKNMVSGKNLDEAIELVRGDGDWVIRKGQPSFRIELEIEVPSRTPYYRYSIFVVRNDKGFRIAAENLMYIGAPKMENRELFLSNVDKDRPEQLILSTPVNHYDDSADNFTLVNAKQSLLSQVDLLPMDDSLKKEIADVADEIKNIFLLNPDPSAMRGYKTASSELKPDASNLAAVLLSLGSELRADVEKRLSEFLRPLPERDINRVYSLPIGLKQKDAILCCEEEWISGDPMQLDANEMSDGTLRFIAIIATLLLRPKGSLVMIEEVDNGLHPSRAKNLVSVLHTLSRERNIDIVCTTHNPVLIDALGIEMVPFISYVSRDAKTGNSRIDLLEEKENLVKLMSNNTVGTLMVTDKI